MIQIGKQLLGVLRGNDFASEWVKELISVLFISDQEMTWHANPTGFDVAPSTDFHHHHGERYGYSYPRLKYVFQIAIARIEIVQIVTGKAKFIKQQRCNPNERWSDHAGSQLIQRPKPYLQLERTILAVRA